MNIDIATPETHTMGNALLKYLNIKIHSEIDQYVPNEIIVRGKHDRKNSIISKKEKSGKLFNFYRPTIEFDKKKVYVNCYPGIDYVRHYANIVASYYTIIFNNKANVSVEMPVCSAAKKELLRSNLTSSPIYDLTIVGNVENFSKFAIDNCWNGSGDFRWKRAVVAKCKALLLGCRFSFWGDIAGKMIEVLAEIGHKNIVYCGKLGGLDKSMTPNVTLATGGISRLASEIIEWESIIDTSSIPVDNNIVCGKHISSYSVISETKEWLSANNKFNFVDPEIGHMAKSSINQKVGFGYLHVVSNNLTYAYNENLGNERNPAVIKKRKNAFNRVWYSLQHAF